MRPECLRKCCQADAVLLAKSRAVTAPRTGRRALGSRLALTQALSFLGIGISLPFLPLWLDSRGFDDVTIGWLLTIPILMRVAASPFVSGLGDGRVAPVRLLACLNAIAALLYLALLPASGVWSIAALLALSAIALSGVVPLIDMLTIAQIRAGAAVDYGHVRLWGSVAFLAANIAGGYWIAADGARIVPVALALSAGMAGAAALAAPAPPAAATPIGRTAEAPSAGFGEAFWLVLAAAAFVHASHAAIYAFGSLHWRGQGVSEPGIGMLWAVGVAAEIGVFLLAGGVVARGVAGLWLMALGAGAAAVRFALMALDPGFVGAILLQVLHGLSFGGMHLGVMAVMSSLAPDGRRAAAQGRLTATGALASAVATLLSGYLYRRYGVGVFLAMTALALAGLALVLLAKRRLHGDTVRQGQ